MSRDIVVVVVAAASLGLRCEVWLHKSLVPKACAQMQRI